MSEEVPNSAGAQKESAVEASGESRDPLKPQDGDIRQRRRPQSADPQRQDRGGNRRRGVNRSWQDRPSALGSGRRPSPREGYGPPRRSSKQAPYRGGGESSTNDRRTHKGRGRDFVNWVNSQIEPGTSYNGKAVHVANLGPQMQAVSECFQYSNENVLVSKGASGSSQSSAGAVNSSDSKEHQEGLKLSRAMDSDRGNEMSKTGKFKERDARSKGQTRGGWRGKNYSQDGISYFYARSGTNYNTSSINKEMGNGNEDNSNFHRMFYLSQADNFKDVRAVYRSPQCYQDSYYSYEPDMTENSKYSRGHRREQLGIEAKEAVYSRRPGRRGDFSYRSQQESVVRALSYLNPVQSSQASALIEQLRNEAYECMICCEGIRCKASIWSCQNCYHVFHLGCVRKWARSPAASVEGGEKTGWRCPACQNVTSEIPSVYKCFCGKVIDPGWRRHEGLTPHSCGELCGKRRDSLQCPHNCNQLCHPGPCPSCPVMITKACPCGRTTNRVRCGQGATVLCKLECNKVLNCLTHRCKRICHPDPCGDCSLKVQQTCYCGKQQREALCGTGEPADQNVDGKSGYFSCQDKCLRILDCGNHRCQGICHRGWCTKCLLKPQLVTHCPCGKTPLNQLLGEGNSRKSCLDPVPTCPLMCGKILPCSPQKEGDETNLPEVHRCKHLCHLGDCGPCDGMTTVRCRCGTNAKEIPCIERHLEEYTCDQRCNKKRHCGRHRCNRKCCRDTDHRCELVCGRKLRCGRHKCLEPCHPGYCPPCLMSSFDELTCHCGASILYPPIPCGTLPPECNKPCSRVHSCSHPVMHSCHSEEVCPPCTVLTKKRCVGDHEVRYNIPCHVSNVSCGKVCGKVLRCGHKCVKICHKPPCLLEEESCLQPCEIPRRECGHPCSSQCHANKECPPVPCRVKVTVTCKCGRRTENFPCLQGGEKMAVAQAYQRLTTETLADKMKDLQSGHSVDTSSIMNVDSKKPRQLACNADCALYERNRRLAEALNIENPDLSQFTPVRYSPFLLAEAKQNLSFIKSIEDALENLVQTTLKISSSQRSHSFSPMNSNQRRLVHELSMFYNCASRSYDQEPKRNTVVTATKSSYLPSVRLSTQIERQINPPPPHPIPYLPSQTEVQSKPPQQGQKKTKTWAQVPDYFADDFED